MSGRILLCLAALILALAPVCRGTAEDWTDEGWEDGNLLFNGGFELIGEDGLPEGWDIDAYVMGTWDTEFSTDRQFVHGGEVSVQLVNYKANDARFVQTVAVEPECMYRLSGWVSADQVSTDSAYRYGANLSVIAGNLTNTHTEAMTETDGEWVYVETYGETGPDQWELEICARLGGFSGTAVGTAWFDDLRLEQVRDLPEGVVASLWFVPGETESDDFAGWDEGLDNFDGFDESWYSEDAGYDAYDGSASQTVTSARPWLYLIAALWVVFAAGVLLLAHFLHGRGARRTRRQAWWIWPVLAAGLVLRLMLAIGILRFDGAGIHILLREAFQPDYAYDFGYSVDMNCFRLWGEHLFDVRPASGAVGCAAFYSPDYFCDYPPLAVFILGVCNLISGSLGKVLPVTWLQDTVLKLPAMLADLGIAWLVGHEAVRRGKGRAFSGLLTVLVALNPALILNSACWGQVDSVLAFALAAVAVFAMRRNWIALMPVYMLAVLYKPQALMLGPLGLAVILAELIRHPECWRRMLIGAGAAILAALTVLLPFSPGKDWTWIFAKYGETLSSYPYVTVNTANLYYLFDLNWEPLKSGADLWPMLCLALLSAGWMGWLHWADRRRGLRRTPVPAIFLSALTVIFAAGAALGKAVVIPGAGDGPLFSYAAMNYAAMALCLFIAIHLWCRSGRIDTLPLCGALLFMLLYTFGCRMHERYVFPALVLLALACAVRHDPRQWIMLLLLSFTFFLNEGIILDNSMVFGSRMGHLNPDTVTVAKILSGLNIAAVLLGLWTAYDLCTAPGNDAPVGRRPKALKGGTALYD